MKQLLFLLFFFGTALGLVSCSESFNSAKWKVEEDLRTFPHRAAMVDDILTNKKFVGLHYSQVIDSLGEASGLIENRMYYSIEVDYGSDIDPVYTKDLVLVINADSLVTDVRTEEWEK